MTLHAAKGLEFPCVFIVGCEENILPLNLEGMTADPGEERRLLYVGMTRAKEQLFLIHAKRRRMYGKTIQNNPSSFSRDIEDNLKNFAAADQKKKKRLATEKQLSLFE